MANDLYTEQKQKRLYEMQRDYRIPSVGNPIATIAFFLMAAVVVIVMVAGALTIGKAVADKIQHCIQQNVCAGVVAG
jgi:hypothetical protein